MKLYSYNLLLNINIKILIATYTKMQLNREYGGNIIWMKEWLV